MRSMKWIIRGLIVAAIVVSLSSCFVFDTFRAQVRFFNNTDNVQWNYGLRMGDAEVSFGGPSNAFNAGQSTDYEATSPGSYRLESQGSDGQWWPESDMFYNLDRFGKYTMRIDGYTDGVDFYLNYVLLED